MSRPYSTSPAQNNNDSSLSAILASHLHQGQPQQPMDARQQPEYPQSGLSSPYANYNGHQSEGTSADQASAVQYPAGQEYKPSNFSSSATPDSSYGLPPQSARSGSFPEYIQRSYADGQPQPTRYQPSAQGNHPGMAQTSSPSIPMADGQQPNGHASQHNLKSDGDVPIDPSIAQSSPSYPPPHNYSPYPPQQEIPQYAAHPMYARPEWQQGQYPQPMQYGHSPATTAGGAPAMVAHHIPRPPPVSRRVFLQRAHAESARVLCFARLLTRFFLGRPPAFHRLLIRSHSGRAAAQASQEKIRRDRENVQVWLERLREGVRHAQSLERSRYHAVARLEAHS